MKNIKIFFIETEEFVSRFIRDTFTGHQEFSLSHNRNEADIILKIEKDVCHFYAKERYESMTFPCDLEDFIRKIKLFFYEDASDHLHFNGFSLDYNILSTDKHDIELSDTEVILAQSVLSAKFGGVEKLVLFNLLGSGADSILYRFRKKISECHMDLILEDSHFTLQKTQSS